MTQYVVETHDRISGDVKKRMLCFGLGFHLRPQSLEVPVNSYFMHAEAQGWRINSWWEVRPPAGSTHSVILQLFRDGVEIPSYAAHLKTFLRGDPSVRITEPATPYHLYMYPSGSKIRVVEEEDNV
jgi:hypothetical protein